MTHRRKNSICDFAFGVGALLVILFDVSQAQIPIVVRGDVPAAVDNSLNPYFPPIVDQGGRECCAHASGIGYVFTYEINAARNVSGKAPENNYPFFYTYDFLNGGSEKNGSSRMFLDAWKIGRENGIVNSIDFGESDLSSTRWVSGFDRYARIMRNRVETIDSFAMTDAGSLRKMKQWLFDHGKGAGSGGLLLYNVYMYGIQEAVIAAGPKAGKTLIKYWGDNHDYSSLHAMTIVGYDDNVCFDFNGDNRFTADEDISASDGDLTAPDGKIDMADCEIGAVKIVNSWGTSWGDGGFAYMPYRSLFISFENGGILNNNQLYLITVKKDYKPWLAFKASLTHVNRGAIALSVGIASDSLSSTPSKIRSFNGEFTYAGGHFPMCGKDASPSIEIGLDVSDLLDSVVFTGRATFFLIVDSRDTGGFIDSLFLMDYSSQEVGQTKASQSNIAIAPGSASVPSRTIIGIPWTGTSVLLDRPGIISLRSLRVIRRPTSIELRVPGETIKNVVFVNARGAKIAIGRRGAEGEWIAAKNALPTGIGFVKVTLTSGKTIVRKIASIPTFLN